MHCQGWCGFCYAGARGRATYPGHFGWRMCKVAKGRKQVGYVQKVPAGSAAVGVVPSAIGDDLAESCPALAEYLVAEEVPGQGARMTATLLIFVEDGQFKSCLYDRDNDRKLWRSGSSWGGLLASLEAALAGKEADWRKALQGPRRKSPGRS